MTVETKSRKVPDAELDQEFRDKLARLLEELEGSDHLSVLNAVIFSSESFGEFLDSYRESVMGLTVDALRLWMAAVDTETLKKLCLWREEQESSFEPWRQSFQRLTDDRVFHIAASKGLAKAEAILGRLCVDEELDAAANDLLRRAEAATDEEEAADLRADAASLRDPALRAAVWRSELALRDMDLARAKGAVLSSEELEAELEGDDA